jgi:hypothetical protein
MIKMSEDASDQAEHPLSAEDARGLVAEFDDDSEADNFELDRRALNAFFKNAHWEEYLKDLDRVALHDLVIMPKDNDEHAMLVKVIAEYFKASTKLIPSQSYYMRRLVLQKNM